MYEDISYEVIMKRMLSSVPDMVDKREGSILYDALAPAAVELQLMYIELDRMLRESFADTQTRTYLIRRAAERGLKPKEASSAIRKGEFNLDIPLGSRFSLGKLNYSAFEKISDGVYKLSCDTPGSDGNAESGPLIPISYIEGLTSAQLTDILIPGEDAETTESFRTRYFESLDAQAFGGNIADYKAKVGAIQGVGGVKVIPTWNGPGTVKVIISSSQGTAPTEELIASIQEAMDPLDSSGGGIGLAPIGHVCTIAGARERLINMTAKITLDDSWTWDDIRPYAEKAVDEYLNSLTSEWSSANGLVVRISQLEARLLDTAGVLDVESTTINSSASNLALEADEIPKRGTLNAT